MKATFIKGLPGIGKSYTAYSISKNAVYNNMDTIRRMYPHYTEPQIKKLSIKLTKMAIENKLDIVLDNTYMFRDCHEYEDYKLLAKAGYDIRTVNMNNLVPDPIATAVVNNANRPTRIPEHVIHRMAFAGYLPDDYLAGKRVYIVDIDGTLYDIRKRVELCKTKDKMNWDLFFDENIIAKYDIFRHDIWDIVDKSAIIIIVSGRKDSTYYITEEMLKANGVKYDHIFMRYNSDYRDDTAVKLNILDILLSKGLDIALTTAIDDRKRVLDLWESKGIKTINVSLEENNDF